MSLHKFLPIHTCQHCYRSVPEDGSVFALALRAELCTPCFWKYTKVRKTEHARSLLLLSASRTCASCKRDVPEDKCSVLHPCGTCVCDRCIFPFLQSRKNEREEAINWAVAAGWLVPVVDNDSLDSARKETKAVRSLFVYRQRVRAYMSTVLEMIPVYGPDSEPVVFEKRKLEMAMSQADEMFMDLIIDRSRKSLVTAELYASLQERNFHSDPRVMAWTANSRNAAVEDRVDHLPCAFCGKLTSARCVICRTVPYCGNVCEYVDRAAHWPVCMVKFKAVVGYTEDVGLD